MFESTTEELVEQLHPMQKKRRRYFVQMGLLLLFAAIAIPVASAVTVVSAKTAISCIEEGDLNSTCLANVPSRVLDIFYNIELFASVRILPRPLCAKMSDTLYCFIGGKIRQFDESATTDDGTNHIEESSYNAARPYRKRTQRT